MGLPASFEVWNVNYCNIVFLAVMLTAVTSTLVFDLIPNPIPEHAYYTKMFYGGLSVLGFTASCFLLLKVFLQVK